jgi:hypothetical protein
MKNMFKKSLVAIALVGASSSAMAATVSVQVDAAVANEWASTVPAGTTTSPTAVSGLEFDFTLGAAYTQNDLVKFSFTGESLLVASLPGTINIAGGASGAGTATLGFISTEVVNGNTVATYRVTAVDGDTTGGTGTVSGLNFRAAALAGNVSVSFAAETATGQALDTAGGAARTGRLITMGSQFASLNPGTTAPKATTNLNATIDVGSSRTQFVGAQDRNEVFGFFASNTSATTYDAFVPTSTYSVTVDEIDYTLTGNFGWMLNPTTGALITARFQAAGCTIPGATVTASSIVVSCTGNTPADLTFDATGNTVVIPTQTIGLEGKVSYTAAGFATAKGTAEGSTTAATWGLNGSEVNVAYMPYSGSISQVINVTNRSNQSGDISVVAIDEAGNSHDLGVVGHSAAGSITRIAGGIQSALSAAAGVNLATVGQTQRFALQIVTNAPEADVEVYSAYNVNGTGARLVVNDSNGGGLSK